MADTNWLNQGAGRKFKGRWEGCCRLPGSGCRPPERKGLGGFPAGLVKRVGDGRRRVGEIPEAEGFWGLDG
jgi:hypothetical protein